MKFCNDLDRADDFVGRKVLDVGSGGGVSALAAAHAEALRVVANDVDPWALAVARIGMSKEHAKSVLNVLQETLDISDQTEAAQEKNDAKKSAADDEHTA